MTNCCLSAIASCSALANRDAPILRRKGGGSQVQKWGRDSDRPSKPPWLAWCREHAIPAQSRRDPHRSRTTKRSQTNQCWAPLFFLKV